MNMQGFPISTKLPDDLGIGERFWYWRGASGRNYIHSIYPADACPPLPGAVFVAVRNCYGHREAIGIGRFPSFLDHPKAGLRPAGTGIADAEEIHVHLLARNDAEAQSVLEDLRRAGDEPEPLPVVRQRIPATRQLSLSFA